jgi:hypothetical protein
MSKVHYPRPQKSDIIARTESTEPTTSVNTTHKRVVFPEIQEPR